MLDRIRLNGGHLQLSIAGHTYFPDDTGAFMVPQDSAKELIRLYGGEIDPGSEALEAQVQQITDELATAKNFIVAKSEELKDATARLDAYKKKQSAASDVKIAAANATLSLNKPQQPNGNNQQSARR